MDLKRILKKYENQPFVNILYVMITICVFLISTYWNTSWFQKGDLDLLRVTKYGEYWRLVTSIFLHNGIDHIMNNMFLLIFLGAMMERQIGHLAYAIIYILSGIGGGMLSLFYKAITNERAASVGASGAVFGLIGVMLALVLLQRHKIPDVTPTRILIVIAFSLYVGMRSQNVDNAGHIGGILTGFFAGVLLCLIHRTQRLKKSR